MQALFWRVKTWCLVLSLMGVAQGSLACINTLFDGSRRVPVLYHDLPTAVPYGHILVDAGALREAYAYFDEGDRAFGAWDAIFYKSLVHIFLGNYTEALSLLKIVESMHPGHYATAANLGTVYELMGNNQEALHWIKEAIVRDSTSHFGSEWIHVAILEAKLKGPDAITSSALLHTDFGLDSVPVTALDRHALVTLRQALFFQLNERITFVKAPDAMVAELLFQLGNMDVLMGDFQNAIDVYQLAAQYGYTGKLFGQRRALADARRTGTGTPRRTKVKRGARANVYVWTGLVMMTLSLGGGTWLVASVLKAGSSGGAVS